MIKIKIRYIVLSFMIFSYTFTFSQEKREIELTAQGILAKVDSILNYPLGEIEGKVKHIYPNGKTFSVNFVGKITREDFLFEFSSVKRGKLYKILYKMGGEDIWVYNLNSIKLFHKMGIDKYDEFLQTNFSFLDFSNADLQTNYTATIVGKSIVKGMDAYKLILKPIFKGGEYGMLTLYVTLKDFLPLRIDFHDRDNAIFKFMTIVKTTKIKNRIFPVRYDMMDIRKGTVTILKIFDVDEDVIFDKKIFRPEKLGE